MADKKNSLKTISLFAGCGGLDLGLQGDFEIFGTKFRKLPFEILAANDVNAAACATLRHNFPNSLVFESEVSEFVSNHLSNFGQIDVLTGGFPCQDFSLAGKRRGLNVKRGQLYLSMVDAIAVSRPKVFIAENVTGLVTWEKGLAIRTIVSDFESLGYSVQTEVLNAADFGVPQHRKRVFIVGVRSDISGDFVFPAKTHFEMPAKGQVAYRTCKQVLHDLEDPEKLSSLSNAAYSRAKLTPGTQGNKKVNADKPSPTIRAEHHGNIEFHYSLPRRLSAREVARIQSFPDNFKFLNSTTDAYRQIGNAVAPVVGWHMGRAVAHLLTSH